MATNIIRAQSNEEFVDIPNNEGKVQKVVDQLGVSLKASLQTFWKYLKTIDVKFPRLQENKQQSLVKTMEGKKGDGQKDQPNMLQLNKNAPLNLAPQKSQKSQKRSIMPQPHVKEQTSTKKQRLQYKKEHKKVISFDQFMNQQQRKLNESYIRRNIQQKKNLNKSMVSQQNQLNSSAIMQSIHNTSHQVLGKLTVKSADKPQIPINSNHIVNLNNETILNISDIDSECNFNILNNSEVLYELKDNKLGLEGADQNQDSEREGDYFTDRKDENNQIKKYPKLQLSEYPFMMRSRKIQLPKSIPNDKHAFSSANSKNPPNEMPFKPITSSQYYKSITSPQNYLDIIDVDNLPENKPPIKRVLSPSANKLYEGSTRKRVKQSEMDQSYDDYSDKSYDEEDLIEKDEFFESMLESRWDFMVEDMLKNGPKNQSNTKDQAPSLKEEFAKYISINFGAMQHIKSRLQNNSRQTKKPAQHSSTNQPAQQQRRQKLSQILKPLDLTPQIQRKKLYNFTNECQSKINIRYELEKSVREDKERQMAEERKRQQQQEEMKRKQQEDMRGRQEEDRLRKEFEEKRRLEQEQRIEIMKQQETIRIAEQLRQQQQHQNQQNAKNQKESQFQAKQSQQPQQLQSSEKPKQDIGSDQSHIKQLKQFGKQPAKLLSAISATAASLFKNPTTDNDSSVNLISDKKSKESEIGLLKKTSSVLEPKTSEIQKKPSSESKSPQIPSTLQNKYKQQKDNRQTKYNPFMAAVEPSKSAAPNLLKQIINSSKRQDNLFKTIIPSVTVTSPQRQPIQQSQSSLMSPVHNKHNTSHYSNLDSSMCEESESNITSGYGVGNLNGSFLNNGYSSQQQSTGMFENQTNPLFSTNTGGSLFGNAYNPLNSTGLFNPQQQKLPTPGALFTNTQMNMFGSNSSTTNLAATQAVSKVPSFMQGHPTIAPGINPQNAMSLFNQRSPNKNEATSLFAQAPVLDKRTINRRDKKSKEERV